MKPKVADNLAAAVFNAMYWATQPAKAVMFKQGAIKGLAKALEEAFPEAADTTESKLGSFSTYVEAAVDASRQGDESESALTETS